jgi:hypothetical protein
LSRRTSVKHNSEAAQSGKRPSEAAARPCENFACPFFAAILQPLILLPAIFGPVFPGSLIFLFLIGVFFRRKNRHSSIDFWAAIAKPRQAKPQLLVMGSLMDEAWQVLHHMSSVDNPLAIRSNVFAYLFSSLRLSAAQSALVARIHGGRSFKDLTMMPKVVMLIIYLLLCWLLEDALYTIANDPKWAPRDFLDVGGVLIVTIFVVIQVFTTIFGESFFSAFLSPFRWAAQRFGALANLLPIIGTYVVRRKGWSVMLAIITGLERYRFAIPPIEQFPKNVPETFVKYENMPAGAEQRALSKRRAWIGRRIGSVAETFSKMVVTAADISALLRTIEEDQTLVHAAYYTDDECIERIADWIADRG